MKILKITAFALSVITFLRVSWDMLSFTGIVPKRSEQEIKMNFILFAVSTVICILLHKKPGKNKTISIKPFFIGAVINRPENQTVKTGGL